MIAPTYVNYFRVILIIIMYQMRWVNTCLHESSVRRRATLLQSPDRHRPCRTASIASCSMSIAGMRTERHQRSTGANPTVRSCRSAARKSETASPTSLLLLLANSLPAARVGRKIAGRCPTTRSSRNTAQLSRAKVEMVEVFGTTPANSGTLQELLGALQEAQARSSRKSGRARATR